MKKVFRILVIGLIASSALVSCKKKDEEEAAPASSNTVTLEGDLTTQTLDASKKYLLKGLVYVNNGVTLTIPAGTTIIGDKASKASLIVNRGGKLMANGTASNPIIFTSSAPAPYKNYGDWGGIIICGRAANNQAVDQLMEGPTDFSVASGDGVYGGTTDNDNSGVLSHIRLEYGGISYSTDKEINAFTFCSVGNGTTIDHLQSSYSGDDAFEWFGGTVNAKYLVSYRSWDDDFDTDFGYSGLVQFGVALRDKNIADYSQSNAFESDNDASGSTKTPKTSVKFSNITVMGPRTFNASNNSANYVQGMHLRRNTEAGIYNSIITGYPNIANFDKYSGTFKVQNNLFAKHATTASSPNANASLFTAGNSNDTTGFYAANKWGAKNSTAAIYKDTILTNGNPVQVAGSAGLTGASFANLTESFWTSVSYLGAMGTTPDAAWEWTSGWLSFTPETDVH